MYKKISLLQIGVWLIVLTAQGQSLDKKLAAMGMTDIEKLIPGIEVSLIYATADNFTGRILYKDLRKAYLHPRTAQMLKKAQELLKKEHQDYSLIVYDAARPMSVQKEMWELVRGTKNDCFVSNPAKGGGLHNYGLAVDVSIIGENGIPLKMGSPYDFFGPEARTDNETKLAETGKISKKELENRLLLRRVMKAAGFRTISSEWWHFNMIGRDEAVRNYPLID